MTDFIPPFESDFAWASTLPSKLYTNPALFGVERQRIFARSWQPAGCLEQVRNPGDYFTADIAGEPVIVVRDAVGSLRAYFNVCRHRAGAVAEGCGNRKTLRCHCHGWTYGLDGHLLAAPEFAGVERFDRSVHGLVPLRAEASGPFVLVNLDDTAASMSQLLGELPRQVMVEELAGWQLVERREYAVRCNWKVYVDNFLEGYDLPVAHPRLHWELDYANYRVETFRYHSLQYAPLRAARAGSGEALYAGGWANGPVLYAWVCPNWMLNRCPDHLQENFVEPLDVGQTRVIFEWDAEPHAFDREALLRGIALGEQTQLRTSRSAGRCTPGWGRAPTTEGAPR
jgi:choline monooxygenase